MFNLRAVSLLLISSSAMAGTSPILTLPIDKAKNIPKENITFSWQKPSDLPDSKIFGYRILISENPRFSSYRAKLDECGKTCTVNVVDSKQTQFSGQVQRLKSAYFWKVQAITPTGSGVWSKISSFKTSATASTEPKKPISNAATYTKIANDGSELPDGAKIGNEPTNWACTRDNKSGLIWEVKTNDGGLRDKDSMYSWYEPDEAKNGGNAGSQRSYEYKNWCKGSECDTNDYSQTINDQRLCGLKNWRIPTKDELISLIVCSDKQYDDETGECVNSKVTAPTIDTFYFPNSMPTDDELDSVYWSISLNPSNPEYAWDVSFTDGFSYWATKRDSYFVRLVSDGR